MKGMMYNVVHPSCCCITYKNYTWTAMSHPCIYRVEHAVRSKQCLRAIRALESVSWPQKGYYEHIFQKLILLVQHHL